MDKETLSHYGWIVILVLILSVLLALATPFGNFIAEGFKAAYAGFGITANKALGIVIPGADLGDPEDGEPDGGTPGGEQAPCEIEGHYIGDGRGEHMIPVTECLNSHTYTCECSTWVVPDGGVYTVSNPSGDKSVFTAGEEIPCGHAQNGDTFTLGDYKYTYKLRHNGRYSDKGWTVDINTDVTDKNQTQYGELIDTIYNEPLTHMTSTFSYCQSLLVAPEIPHTVKSMESTFNSCKALKTYVGAPEGTADGDFSGYKLPDGMISLCGTFASCYGMRLPPKLPDSVTTTQGLFAGCLELTTAPQIPNTVTYMPTTFSYCKKLETYVGAPEGTAPGDFSGYVIPEGVTSMQGTFETCYKLTVAPKIPSTVTHLGSAFMSCTSLSVTPEIPNGVTYMGQTFSQCVKLPIAPKIPETVTSLDSTFYRCTFKTYVGAPAGTADGDFSGYKIPESVTDMTSTFQYCNYITIAPKIPQNIERLTHTFYGCESLTTAPEIPSSAEYMNAIFWYCPKLTGTVIIHANPSKYNKDCFGGVNFETQKITLSGTSTMLDLLGSSGLKYCDICNGQHLTTDGPHQCHGGNATCVVLANCVMCGEKYGEYGYCDASYISGNKCTKCGKDATVIETAHNPYPNSQNNITLGTWDYSDAQSVTIIITYETESLTWDWAYLKTGNNYINADGEITTSAYKFGGALKETKTFTTTATTGSVIFKSNGSKNAFYGICVVVIPNY